MAVKRLPLPKKYKGVLPKIMELVSTRGVSKTICINSFELPPNFFNRHPEASTAYNKALSDFASNVLMKEVTENLKFDSGTKRLLINKMRIFDDEITLPVLNMKTPAHASENLSFSLRAFSEKKISEATLQEIRKSCEVFSGLHVATSLQVQVKNLEEIMIEKGLK